MLPVYIYIYIGEWYQLVGDATITTQGISLVPRPSVHKGLGTRLGRVYTTCIANTSAYGMPFVRPCLTV